MRVVVKAVEASRIDREVLRHQVKSKYMALIREWVGDGGCHGALEQPSHGEYAQCLVELAL